MKTYQFRGGNPLTTFGTQDNQTIRHGEECRLSDKDAARCRKAYGDKALVELAAAATPPKAEEGSGDGSMTWPEMRKVGKALGYDGEANKTALAAFLEDQAPEDVDEALEAVRAEG